MSIPDAQAMAAHQVVQNTTVPHTAYEKGEKALKKAFRYALHSDPICVAILGESGTGKSRLLEEFEDDHPRESKEGGTVVPVLRIKTPSKPTVKGLVEEMLIALKDPSSKRTSEQRMTARLKTLLVNCETRVVCVDEFQHFRDKVSDKVAHHVADWLKVLLDETKVGLVVAGLPICRSIINQNEQLARRVRATVSMPRFDWSDDDSRAEFVGILGSFYEQISTRFDLPDLASGEMAFRCYCASGGLIGYVVNVLQGAVLEADFSERSKITLEDLNEEYTTAVWENSKLMTLVGPFDPKFKCRQDDPVLLSQVALVGLPAMTEERKKRGKRTSKAESASSHLSAA